jgi:hypothetical protein
MGQLTRNLVIQPVRMPRKTRYRATLLRFVAAMLGLGCIASAQSQPDSHPRKWLDCDVDWIFSEATVGPNFSIQISFHRAPVARTRISLEKDGKVVATSRTNQRGVARFDAIPPGKYHPESPDGLLFPSGIMVVEVKAGYTSGKKVALDWPGGSVAYRFLRGRFTISEQLSGPETPLRNAAIELREVYTGRLIESTSTDSNGDYQFATTNPGVYALRLVLPKKNQAGIEKRDLAVELNPAAEEYSIPEMKVVQSDCAGVQLLRRSVTDDRSEPQ